jgi:hypothetical protein
MPTVDLTELQGAVEWVSDSVADGEAFVCRQTGRIYWISDDGSLEPEELPDDTDDTEKYAPVPDKYELDIGVRLVFDFTKIRLPDQYEEVRSIFRRKGAYRRFKALLVERNLLERWYDFSEEQTLAVLEEWCASVGLAAKPRDRSSA